MLNANFVFESVILFYKSASWLVFKSLSSWAIFLSLSNWSISACFAVNCYGVKVAPSPNYFCKSLCFAVSDLICCYKSAISAFNLVIYLSKLANYLLVTEVILRSTASNALFFAAHTVALVPVSLAFKIDAVTLLKAVGFF